MKDMRIQATPHKKKNFAWPIDETPAHWITLGLDNDLNKAMTLAGRNAIKFPAERAKLTELDAYALCSIAVSFRVTQVVDIVRGVHAMIPGHDSEDAVRRRIATKDYRGLGFRP